jgi:hypothetical protein
MAIIAQPKNLLTYDYTPMTERGDKKPFTVTVKRLTTKEYTFIEDKIARFNQDQSITFNTGTFNWEIVKKGLVDWKNLIDGEGKPIKIVIGSEGVLDSSLNLLPLDIISEIATLIVNITKDPENIESYLGEDSK